MTTPSPRVADAVTTLDNAVTTAKQQAVVNTSPPGAVQSGIDFVALGTAFLDFAQVGADALQAFTQVFEAAISEALAAANLAAAIVGDIEGGISAGAAVAHSTAAGPVCGVESAADSSPTVSSVLVQVQQAASANTTLLNKAFNDAATSPGGLPASFETQVLGGQLVFDTSIVTTINSFPSEVSETNESDSLLIATLQNLLANIEAVSTTLNDIDANDTLQQPVSLTGLNVLLLFNDALVLTNVSSAAVQYALFARQELSGQLLGVTTPGDYTVSIPAGATYVDIVLCSGGGGAGGYNYPDDGPGGDGGDTTATPTGGGTLTATGGAGGNSTSSVAATAGGSPGDESFDGETYTGGTGGAPGNNSAGGNGTAPGGGGGGGGAFGSYGGVGGDAGVWVAGTIPITSGMTEITGTVGAGGPGGASTNAAVGGNGGNGAAFFYFYS